MFFYLNRFTKRQYFTVWTAAWLYALWLTLSAEAPIAHDINNALMPIVAYSEMMLNGKPDLSEDALRRMQVIHRCSRDIAHTVMRMREFYRRSEALKSGR